MPCCLDLQVLKHCIPGDTHLTSLQIQLLGHATYGLSTVLESQLVALVRLRGPQLSRAQQSALKNVLDQRMQWVGAAAALAKIQHHVADAAAGGSGIKPEQWGLARELARDAWKGLHIVLY